MSQERDDVDVVLYMANGQRVRASIVCGDVSNPDQSMMIGVQHGGAKWSGAYITADQLDNFCRQGADLAKRAGADLAAAKAAFLAEVARRLGNEWRVLCNTRVAGLERIAVRQMDAAGFTPEQINALATTGELPKGDADADV